MAKASGQTTEIIKAIRSQLHKVNPAFTFTAVQFVFDGRAALHTDKHNVGMSMSLHIEPCFGGQLCLCMPGTGELTTLGPGAWH